MCVRASGCSRREMFELHVRTHAPDRQRDSNKVWLILQNNKKKKEKEKKNCKEIK